MHICIYMGVGGLREEGLNIMEQGHWLGTAGQIQARLVKEYKWRDTRTVRYKYSDKREYILQTQCKENRGKIWVSRAYWVISTNDLQIFFFEGATISFQLLRIALYFKDPIWEDLIWRVIVSHNWQVRHFQIVIAIVVSDRGGFLFIHTLAFSRVFCHCIVPFLGIMSFSFSQALISETCPLTQPLGSDGQSQVT